MSLPRLRAPRESGAILAEPPLDQAGGLVQRNRRNLSNPPLQILGKPFAELRLVWLLYVLVAVQSAFGAVDRPARSTFIPGCCRPASCPPPPSASASHSALAGLLTQPVGCHNIATERLL